MLEFIFSIAKTERGLYSLGGNDNIPSIIPLVLLGCEEGSVYGDLTSTIEDRERLFSLYPWLKEKHFEINK